MQVQKNPGTDFHRRDADAIAGAAITERVEQNEANARAWGKLAIQSIRAGDYKTAIVRLEAGISATNYSQYHGTRFDS